MTTILIIILILALLGGIPGGPIATPYNGYGWYPSGGIGLVLLIVILLLVFRVI